MPALEPVSTSQEDGPCIRGGAFVGGELLDDLPIHDETGLIRWDGEPIHYGDVVEVLCAADEPSDLGLPVKAWLRKHDLDA